MIEPSGLLNSPVRQVESSWPAAAPVGVPSAPVVDGQEFGKLLLDLASGAAEVLRSAERTSVTAVRGQASVQQAVEAVMTAEQTLQTTMAIRDKAVAAYLELSRMAI